MAFGRGTPRPAVEEQGLPRLLAGTAPVSAVDGPTLLALAVAEEGESRDSQGIAGLSPLKAKVFLSCFGSRKLQKGSKKDPTMS